MEHGGLLVAAVAVLLLLTAGRGAAAADDEEIPAYYRLHDLHYDGKTEACDEQTAGPQARLYCSGRLLEAVMAFKLYDDSKTFVDLPALAPPDEVLDHFERMFPHDDNLTAPLLKKFVETYFEAVASELEVCELADWVDQPPKLQMLRDPGLRNYANILNGIWKVLCRQMRRELKGTDRHSIIFVPEQFVIPGGRFREFYYWDTYWIIKGLLASGMHKTVRGMLMNFVHIVEKHGMIPNGGRIYYLKRSQPPFLIPMFYEYYQATGDRDFIEQNLHIMEKELEFWDSRRNITVEINGRQHQMFQYRAESNVPRPESFREDVELTRDMPLDEKVRTWQNLASAAEAGWDFSSRWFRNSTELSTIDTTNIVEVDLNAFICWNINILAYFYSLMREGRKKEIAYRTRLFQFRRSFQEVFFVDEQDGWYDYNLRNKSHHIEFYPSNTVPLFTKCYDSLDQLKVERVYDRVRKFGALKFNGGIPTSMHLNTGQQWDFPNAWPPLQHMLIEGLRQSESPVLQEEAFELAKAWIRVNYDVFNSTSLHWEKYQVDGRIGGGGEYAVQAGFGWTNGAVLDLMVTYWARLNSSEFYDLDLPTHAKESVVRIFGFEFPITFVLIVIAFCILCFFVNGLILLK